MTLRRRLVVAAVALLTLIALVAPIPEPTDASWGDDERASAELTSMTVAPPHITGCTASYVVLLGSTIKITWEPGPGATYGKGDVEALGSENVAGLIDGTGLLSGADVEDNGDGTYTTTLESGLLSDLLKLGQTFYVGLQATDPASEWTSEPAYAQATVPILLGTGTCDVVENG